MFCHLGVSSIIFVKSKLENSKESIAKKMLKITCFVVIFAITVFARPSEGFKRIEILKPEVREINVTESPSPRSFQCGQAPLFEPQIERIINGSYVPVRGAYPFMVNIKMGWQHWCGGAVYDKYNVISAAHCFWEGQDPSSLKLFFADKDQKLGYEIETGQERRYVEKITLHPRYSKDGWNSNDIAILKMTEPVPFTDQIQPICLPTVEVQGGENTVTMGWGDTRGTSNGNILSVVQVPVIPKDTCKQWYGGLIKDCMVCAGYEEGMQDSCQGDSGGPLAMKNADGAFELIGVVSWGSGCAQARQPGVYADVLDYVPWIKEVAGEAMY